MKYIVFGVVFLTFLASCESESAEDLLQQPISANEPAANSDTTVTDTTVAGPTVSFVREVKPLIDTKCATSGCHAAFGNFPTLETYAQINQSKTRVNARITQGTMPPSGPLPQNEKDLIQTWINEGALNN